MSEQPVPTRKPRFDSITRRFVLALALVPIVPASSVISEFVVQHNVSPAPIDDIWWQQLFFSVFWMSGFILVWRSAVLWTLGRTGLTALVSLIPFVQVAFNQPLWNVPSGCNAYPELLRYGQHYSSCGLWTWLVVWVWWGLEKATMTSEREEYVRGRRSLWLARLAASLGMFPCVFGLFLIVAVFLETVIKIPSSGFPFWVYSICSVFALIAWLLIWRRAVQWSPSVLGRTLSAWGCMVVLPIAAQLLGSGGNTVRDISIAASPVIGWGVWMAWTMWYWPMRVEASAADGPKCLRCGYSLHGLTATRCPECGDEPTLDQLWAASSSVFQ